MILEFKINNNIYQGILLRDLGQIVELYSLYAGDKIAIHKSVIFKIRDVICDLDLTIIPRENQVKHVKNLVVELKDKFDPEKLIDLYRYIEAL